MILSVAMLMRRVVRRLWLGICFITSVAGPLALGCSKDVRVGPGETDGTGDCGATPGMICVYDSQSAVDAPSDSGVKEAGPSGDTWNPGTSWTHHPSAVITPGVGAAKTFALSPAVLLEDQVYRMWFTSSLPKGDGTGIAYATSTDGVGWKVHDDLVLGPGPAGSWYDLAVLGPCVARRNSQLLAWFVGQRNSTEQASHLGLAFSSDGISWTVHGAEPVLRAEDNGTGTTNGFDGCSVIDRGGTFWIWYGAAEASGERTIRYATSTAGIQWTAAKDPVIRGADIGAWAGEGVSFPAVLANDGGDSELSIWFSDTSGNGIGYGQSDDGVSWSFPKPSALVLKSGPVGSWNHVMLPGISVVRASAGKLTLWYAAGVNAFDIGGPNPQTWFIGLATSP
jgi:hypothetical protein